LAAMLALGALGLAQLTVASAVPALSYTSNYWVVPGAGRRAAYWILLAVVLASPVARAIIYFHSGKPTSGLSATHFNLDHIGTGCLLAFARTRLHSITAYVRFIGSRIFVAVTTNHRLGYVPARSSQHPPNAAAVSDVSIALCM
jgi:hypothetical protein